MEDDLSPDIVTGVRHPDSTDHDTDLSSVTWRNIVRDEQVNKHLSSSVVLQQDLKITRVGGGSELNIILLKS